MDHNGRLDEAYSQLPSEVFKRERFEGVEKSVKEAHTEGKYVMGSIGSGLWQLASLGKM